jgi:uncharacterized protein YukE
MNDLRAAVRKKKPSQSEGPSTRKVTSRMVEHHLNKQRTAYDRWIAELCRDAEESAMERDRLRAKLEALRNEHKRKIMSKVVGRMGNMTYAKAWKTWASKTAVYNQEKLKELRRNLKKYNKAADEADAEAQRRSDEMARLVFGNITDRQKKLVWRILTRLSTLKKRLGWKHWEKQAFAAKHQKLLMTKILKRLKNAKLNQSFNGWSTIVKKWELIKTLELKAALMKELEEIERQSKQYKDDAEQRQNDAAKNAFARASGKQKDLLVRILSKMTGNQTVMVFKIWKRKSDEFQAQYNLMYKTFTRMMKIKIYTAYRHWFKVVFLSGLSKTKMREALLQSQRDNLFETLKRRAEQLLALRDEANEMLSMSVSNDDENKECLNDSVDFENHIRTILDKGWMEKKAKEEARLKMMAEMEGGAPAAGGAKNGAGAGASRARAGAPARSSRQPAARSAAPRTAAAPRAARSAAPRAARAPAARAPRAAPARRAGGGGGYQPPARAPRQPAARSGGYSGARGPATSSRPRPNPGDMGVNMKQELMLFIFELNKQGLITLPKEDADAVKKHHKDHMGINSPVHRHIRGRENWPEPQDTFLVPELEKMVGESLGGIPGGKEETMKQRAERVLKPLAMAGDSRLYAAKKAYEKTHKIDDLFATMDMMGCLPPARKL